ncbi:MAG: chemotaxis protein CheW [Burkholderiaceae bacterium]
MNVSTIVDPAPANRLAAAHAEATQYLTFMLGGETFAIGILSIKEIIEYRSMTEVPMMPDGVRGVINLRGAVVPVLDLQARFGRPPGAVGKRTCIVIIELATQDASAPQVVGVVVDAVNEVLEIDASQIEPPPPFGARIRSEFIHGMGKVDGRFVILLDVTALVDVEGAAAVALPDTPAIGH